jgi:GDP-D-mannose dehydratase
LCTGKKVTAREFINKVAKILNINIYWIKKNGEHLAIDAMNKKTILKTSKKFYRNDNFYNFKGNNKKARKLLDWKPDTDIKKLIKKMINFEINR